MEALAAVAAWPVDNAAVAVARTGPPGSGPAERPGGLIGSVGPVRTRFAWASVTKPATALAVLIASEQGLLSLDEPAGPEGATVRHLLAHASGLGLDPGPPRAPPGTIRIYSNAGYLVLADLVAERSGRPFAGYLAEQVLGPLGMDATRLDAEAPAGGPAAGLSGPLVDLVALGLEWARPRLVGPGPHRAATTAQFGQLPGVLPGFGRFEPCPWGLGVEIRGHKRPHWTGAVNSPSTFGHFGRTGSFLWVDPEAGLLCAGLADRAFASWAVRAWPALSDAVLAEAAAAAGPGPAPPAR